VADDVTSEDHPAEPAELVTEEAADPKMEDLFSKDLDKMRTEIDSAIYAEEQATPDPVDEMEAPSDETVDKPESEPEVEVEQVAQSEATPENGESDVTEADELRAMLELQQAETRRLEGHRAGEDGFFKNKAAQLEREILRLRQQPQDGSYPEPVAPAMLPSAPDPISSNNQKWMMDAAEREASQEFLDRTPGVMIEKDGKAIMDPSFAEALGPSAKDIREAKSTGDATYVKAETSRLLNAAWSAVDRDRKEARLDEVRRKRADQAKRLTDKKRVSAASSPSSTTATPQKRRVDPRKLSTEKLKQLAQEEAEAAGLTW